MNTYAVTTTKEVTEQDIENIMSSAMTGCTHWVSDMKVSSKLPLAKRDFYASEAFSHDCIIKFQDRNTDKWHAVTRDSILKALSETPSFDYENYDSLDADDILQKACFGKALYA